MLAPGSPALNREQALELLEQLVEALRELRRQAATSVPTADKACYSGTKLPIVLRRRGNWRCPGAT
jgi:hypothetical protein